MPHTWFQQNGIDCSVMIIGGCFDKSTPRLSSTFSARPPRFSRRREWLIPIGRSLPDPCKPFHGPESATPPCVVTFPWGLLYTQHIKENILKYYPLEGLIKSTRAICKRFSAATRRNFAGIVVFISRNRNEVVAEKIRKAPQAHLISASLYLSRAQIGAVGSCFPTALFVSK